MKKSKTIKPFPFYVYYWASVLITGIGLAASLYLSISHYRIYTDIEYKSFCAISKAFNCDTVSQSPYAIVLNLPVAVWGVMGYVFVLLLLYFAGSKEAHKTRIWSLIFWVSFVFSCTSVILALISTHLIRSYCIMCIATYAVNLALVFYAWIIQRRFSNDGLIKSTRKDALFLWEKKIKSIPIFMIFLVAAALTWLFFPVYWNLQPPPLAANIPKGITASGHPWIGAEKPVLEIIEYSDYQCFQCKKMHFYLRLLVAENVEKIRIVHKNYPMDNKYNPIVKELFHQGAGKMALLAIYAAKKNKFWELNDLLYRLVGHEQVINVKELAESLDLGADELTGFMNDPSSLYQLRYDIWTGNKLGISGTPAYLIDGKVYQGQIPPEIIKKVLE